MKGQDVVMMSLLRLHPRRKWTYEDLSAALGQSASQCHAARKRLHEARLLSTDPEKPWHVPAENFVEYLVHGVKYDFPPKVGAPVHGIATAHSSAFVNEHLRSADTDASGVVWPWQQGSDVGRALDPIHPSQLHLCVKSGFEDVYRMLVYVDLLRIGQARERSWAAVKIKEIAHGSIAN